MVFTFEERTRIFEELGVDVVIGKTMDYEYARTSREDFIVSIAMNFKVKPSFAARTILSATRAAATWIFEILSENAWNSAENRAVSLHGQRRQNQQQLNQKISVGRAYAPCKPAYGASLYDFGRRRALFRARSRIRFSDGKPFPSRRKSGNYGRRLRNDGRSGRIYLQFRHEYRQQTDFQRLLFDNRKFLVDYKGNLYDKYITVYFYSKIRDIKKFNSEWEVRDQIGKDLEVAKMTNRNL